MNGTFHIIQDRDEEIWLDGENIERLTKTDEGGDVSRYFNVEVVRKCGGIALARKPEIICSVAAIVFYPNTKVMEDNNDRRHTGPASDCQ